MHFYWIAMAVVAYYSTLFTGQFLTGKFVGEIENIIWSNWHSFKFPY